MNNWLQKYHTRHSRKEERQLEHWARTRNEGPARYIFQTTVRFGLIMMLSYDFSAGRITLENILAAHLGGLLMGWVGWCSVEKNYQKALLAVQAKAVLARISRS